MGEELVNGISLVGVDAEEVGDEVFGGRRNVVPPWRKESVVSTSDLFSQDIDTLVVEGWESVLISERR